jgi:predicted RNA-binding protein associated with RNAse of E/G family
VDFCQDIFVQCYAVDSLQALKIIASTLKVAPKLEIYDIDKLLKAVNGGMLVRKSALKLFPIAAA